MKKEFARGETRTVETRENQGIDEVVLRKDLEANYNPIELDSLRTFIANLDK